MTLYFAVVDPGPREPPELMSVEQGTARIRFPRVGRELTFELMFSQEGFDQFLASRRTIRDAQSAGARLTICTPHELLGTSKETTQEGVSTLATFLAAARTIGISELELRIAHRVAWSAILRDYQVRKR